MDQYLGSSSTDALTHPVPGGRSLTTQQRQSVDLAASIPGWGSDLDRRLRPGVPRDKAPEIGVEHLYPPIEPQQTDIKIHKSTEHARMTPVFGTSCPPTGLSGKVRDAAYKMSEGRLSRWMALMAADRIGMVEGLVADLAQAKLPNLAKETGFGTEWRYNRQAVTRKAVIGGAVLLGAIVLVAARRGRGRLR